MPNPPYTLNLGVLADYAAVDQNNKLLIGGEFDTIWTSKLPSQHPGAYIVARVESESEPPADAEVSFSLVGPDDSIVFPPTPPQRLPFKQSEASGRYRAQIFVEMRPLPLKQLGRHGFQVTIGDIVVGRIPLLVKERK